MTKLPSIFHVNSKIVSNNKNSFNTFDKERISNDSNSNKDLLINYFNKMVVIELNNGNKTSGILISKRNDRILLNTGESINVNDILKIN